MPGGIMPLPGGPISGGRMPGGGPLIGIPGGGPTKKKTKMHYFTTTCTAVVNFVVDVLVMKLHKVQMYMYFAFEKFCNSPL